MNIGIVGTGNMGRVLGLALAEQGHPVFFGARNLEKAKLAAQLGAANTFFGNNQQAAEFGEVVYYNPRDVHPAEVLSNPDALNGKVVVASHNGTVPVDFAFAPVIESRAEILQSQIPRAHVVAAFNTITQEIFEHANHSLHELNIACFIAGDQAGARATVAQLAASIGFTPMDCGELRQARLIESAADLVRMLLYKQKNPWASFSFTQVPPVQPGRLGGRQASSLTRR
ncbi:MAG: NAD(P)-binding domain-containing protein [Nitrosomonadales bacterium]|nr:NAD(P)-binding domain-containing protein [Nitrosomonadales bacterium]